MICASHLTKKFQQLDASGLHHPQRLHPAVMGSETNTGPTPASMSKLRGSWACLPEGSVGTSTKNLRVLAWKSLQ